MPDEPKVENASGPKTSDEADDPRMFALPGGLGLVLVLLGSGLVALGVHQAHVTAAMRMWRPTMGTVSTSQIDNVRAKDGWEQWSDIRVRYTVAGRSYETSVDNYVGRSNSHHTLRYSVGDSVPVFYDPADPSRGALTNDRNTPDHLGVLFGSIAFVLSLPFWFFSARMLLKRRRPSGVPSPAP